MPVPANDAVAIADVEHTNPQVEAVLAALARGDKAAALRLARAFRLASRSLYLTWLLDTKLAEASPAIRAITAALAGLANPPQIRTAEDDGQVETLVGRQSFEALEARRLILTGLDALDRTPEDNHRERRAIGTRMKRAVDSYTRGSRGGRSGQRLPPVDGARLTLAAGKIAAVVATLNPTALAYVRVRWHAAQGSEAPGRADRRRVDPRQQQRTADRLAWRLVADAIGRAPDAWQAVRRSAAP